MKVAIVYVFPQVDIYQYGRLARRFATTYMDNPPGITQHSLYVIANGSPPNPPLKALISPLPATWLNHNNYGKDIGAFQFAAGLIDCDLMVCFGSHINFWKPGWLDTMMKAYLENGPTFYGAWGFHEPMVHIRTTAFWLPPQMLNSYPVQVNNGLRYEFEHGHTSIMRHCQKLGFEPLMVTQSGVYGIPHWRHVEQRDCLFFDQHCERIGYR